MVGIEGGGWTTRNDETVQSWSGTESAIVRLRSLADGEAERHEPAVADGGGSVAANVVRLGCGLMMAATSRLARLAFINGACNIQIIKLYESCSRGRITRMSRVSLLMAC